MAFRRRFDLWLDGRFWSIREVLQKVHFYLGEGISSLDYQLSERIHMSSGLVEKTMEKEFVFARREMTYVPYVELIF